MPSRTPFAGLLRLAPGEPLSSDNSAFSDTNMVVIDRLTQVGAVTHHHDGHAALANPTDDPTAVALPTGGTIPADVTITIVYTIVDADGGETIHNTNPVVVSTQASIDAPDGAPTLDLVDYTVGTLLADTYYYAVSVTDGTGGETAIGPSVQAVVDPGHANAEVKLKDLTAIVTAAGGTGWRMWRSTSGGSWQLLNTGATDTFNDDGSFCVDSSATPPSGTSGNTNNTNRIQVTVPDTQPAATDRFRIYGSPDGTLESPCLLGDYPIADAGTVKTYTALVLNDGSPPAVSQALPGANKISLETDILNNPWREPVANAAALPLVGNIRGDIRETLDDLTLHVWNSSTPAWDAIGGGGGGGSLPGTSTDWADVTFHTHWSSGETDVKWRRLMGVVWLAGNVIDDGSGVSGDDILEIPDPDIGTDPDTGNDYGPNTPEWIVSDNDEPWFAVPVFVNGSARVVGFISAHIHRGGSPRKLFVQFYYGGSDLSVALDHTIHWVSIHSLHWAVFAAP